MSKDYIWWNPDKRTWYVSEGTYGPYRTSDTILAFGVATPYGKGQQISVTAQNVEFVESDTFITSVLTPQIPYVENRWHKPYKLPHVPEHRVVLFTRNVTDIGAVYPRVYYGDYEYSTGFPETKRFIDLATCIDYARCNEGCYDIGRDGEHWIGRSSESWQENG